MSQTLVMYYSATGTTKAVAEQVANSLNADLFQIKAAQPYNAADLNWHDQSSRTTIEQHTHKMRVAIDSNLPDISKYDTILIGHPIWWGIPPRMIASLIDELKFNGKTVAGFATSGGTGYDRSQSFLQRTLAENDSTATLKKGAVLRNNAAAINNWTAQFK